MKKGILIFSIALLATGLGIYAYKKFSKPKTNAEFTKDSTTYKMDKSAGYEKKKGDWAGNSVTDFDSDYYQAINSSGVKILLKKTDVKLI